MDDTTTNNNRPIEPASAEPTTSRRRGGNTKRKANNSSNYLTNEMMMYNSTPTTTSSKRFKRELAAIAAMQQQSLIHSGPCTRAAAASAVSAVSIEPVTVSVKVEDERSVSEEWKALENAIEVEYEVVKSREAGVHVVPNHCGWFSWTKHHPLEEQALPSFFDGKSENRSLITYMEIRNWIVKKFHSNPNKLIELKDLEDLNVGDLDARQVVMEFLDYWGLINFHPFPQDEIDASDVKAGVEEPDKNDDLSGKLFKFETLRWCPPVTQKPTTPTPLTPKLLAEPTIQNESVKPEGPSVEYHCNSCSTDCSRKRFHCQKEADYDLCTECFNNGKFGSDMLLSDFILMEPAEVPSLSSATWTDQETLLLLEALELYKENWNEIAEHVATKNKDQCILHFVQMPIEDSFLATDLATMEDNQESVDIGLNNCTSSTPKKGSEATDGLHYANEDQSPSDIEKSKPEDASENKVSPELDENVAFKALREAFEAVGSLPEPGFEPTFADAGNPVMAMAVFLARFVGSDAATASSRSSLKTLSGKSPSIELATRHCFVLEDPPSNIKVSVTSESITLDGGNRGFKNNGKMENMSIHTETEDLSANRSSSKTNDCVGKDSSILPSSDDIDKDQSDASKETGTPKIDKPVKKTLRGHMSNGEPKESVTGSVIELSQTTPKDLNLNVSKKKKRGVKKMASVDNNRKSRNLAEKTAVEDHVKEALKKDNDESAHSEEGAVKKHDKLMPSPSSAEEPRDSAASSGKPSNSDDETDHTQKNDHDFSGNPKGNVIKHEVQNSDESKEQLAIDKVKRAAITTLAAAAVKAKLLADHEEEEIKKLAVYLIDKQLRKLEIKMALFDELGSVTMRVKEQLDRTRQKLYQERAQIIAARLGLPSSHPRPMSSSMPQNRNAMNLANSGPRPPMSLNSLRPPIGRPTMSFAPAPTNPFQPTMMGHNSLQPQSQDNAHLPSG